MSTSPVSTSTGSSSFGVDLQNAVNRAVAIASLPIQQLKVDQSKVDGELTEIGQFGTLFTNLQNSFQSLSSGTGSKALAATVSDSAVLQASITGNAMPGTYEIQVLDPGASAKVMSIALPTPVTDPSGQTISQSNSFTLTVDGTTYTLQPPAQNLKSLAAEINASGAPVRALVINLGSPSQPDYHLIIQSTTLGDIAIQLNDGSSDLMSSLVTGANASYTIDGQPPGGISSNSRTVTIAPGLNVNIQSAGSSTVTVANSTKIISDALTSFVDSYNATVAELDKNHGQGGGALTGNSNLLTMGDALRQIVNYQSSSGTIRSLTDLGVEFTQQGTLTFDSSKLGNFSATQADDVVSFLGDPATGGFLKFTSDTLKSINDPIDGVLASELQTLQAHSQRDQQAISDAQDRVNQLQANLLAQMAAADALIATLQQQTQFLQGLFEINSNNQKNGR